MKNLQVISKFVAVIAIFAMAISFASCSLINGGGSLELESFTVDRTSVKTAYLIGEEIDFSGIKATVKYSDETLNKVYTYGELTITYADDITATEGKKYVTVSFDDPHLNVKQETKVEVTVTKEPVIDDTPDPEIVVQFEKPASLISFESDNSGAGQSSYGDASFSGEFAKGEQIYVIGDDNAFKLLPTVSVIGENDNVEIKNAFFAVVDISVYKDGTYVALTKTEVGNNVVSYYDGETLIATVDTYNGSYDFSEDAVGKKVNISILPSEDHYIFTSVNAVTLEANIIDAYNVYEAWQLAVIDNDTSRSDWDEIKTANGIKDLNVAGIVLHADIKITSDDVPQSFFYTTENEVVYTNSVNGETKTIPAGTKYLMDAINIYQRNGASDFAIYGNFFNLDTSEFPLVASPGVFGKDSGRDYGSDFSNTTLIRFATVTDSTLPKPDDVAVITINNISLIGNAKRDNYVDSTESLASAGGLIFIKSSHHSEVTINNSIGNSYFITYFADYGGDLLATDVKCYDSYQNAAMVWGDSILTFTDSYLNGCGGPVIIAQSVIDENKHPTLTVTNTVTETHLSGEEIWFTAINANAIVGQIKGLGNGLAQAGFGNFVDESGKMNIIGLLMASGTDAEVVIGGVNAQGSMSFDGHGMNRNQDSQLWQIIYNHPALASAAPFLTVYDEAGAPHTVFFNGTTFCDLLGNELGTDASHAALFAAFRSADYITLTQGGLSVTFEFYH